MTALVQMSRQQDRQLARLQDVQITVTQHRDRFIMKAKGALLVMRDDDCRGRRSTR
jgi:hypothetical protein